MKQEFITYNGNKTYNIQSLIDCVTYAKKIYNKKLQNIPVVIKLDNKEYTLGGVYLTTNEVKIILEGYEELNNILDNERTNS